MDVLTRGFGHRGMLSAEVAGWGDAVLSKTSEQLSLEGAKQFQQKHSSGEIWFWPSCLQDDKSCDYFGQPHSESQQPSISTSDIASPPLPASHIDMTGPEGQRRWCFKAVQCQGHLGAELPRPRK